MKKKKIIGIALLSIGIGALVYLYKGFYVPRKEVENMSAEELKKETPTTTTK
jgi:uncharacterized protein YneF (UPF0154 family)